MAYAESEAKAFAIRETGNLGSRRSVSIAPTPQAAGRGTDCPRRGVPQIASGMEAGRPKPVAGFGSRQPGPKGDALIDHALNFTVNRDTKSALVKPKC